MASDPIGHTLSSPLTESNVTTQSPRAFFEAYSEGSYMIVGVYLILCSFVALPANGFILATFATKKSIQNPMNLLFANLALSDFVISLFGSFIQAISSMARTYMAPGTAICDLYGFSVFLGGEASLASATVIAIERYLTILRPFGIGPLNYRRAVCAIVWIWSFAALWAVGPLVGWSRFIPEGLGSWCSVDFDASLSASNASYFLCVFIISFLIPIGIIVFSYTRVYMKVKEMAQSEAATESTEKAQRDIAKMSAIMVTFFLIAWMPYAFVGFLMAFGPPGVVTHTGATVPSLFAKSSCIYNPVIYIGMNKPTREELMAKEAIFQERYGLAGCVACNDGTYVPMERPTVNEAAFYCRKHYHALNVMFRAALMKIFKKDLFNMGESSSTGTNNATVGIKTNQVEPAPQ